MSPDAARAAGVIAERTGVEHHDVVVVLGSGLGSWPDTFPPETRAVPYERIPGFPLPQVQGHAGTAYSVRLGDNRTLVLSGRVHAYEGHSMEAVTFAVRTAVLGGCRTVVLTNAAGACGDDLDAGDLAVVTDHVNHSGISPLAGPTAPEITSDSSTLAA